MRGTGSGPDWFTTKRLYLYKLLLNKHHAVSWALRLQRVVCRARLLAGRYFILGLSSLL